MKEEELKLFISEHGKNALKFAEQALLLGYRYIFPEPNFDREIQEVLKKLMKERRNWGDYIIDFKVFRKSQTREFKKELIRRDVIESLFEFSKFFYSNEISMRGMNLKEYWDEIDIYRRAKRINQDEFKNWLVHNLLTNQEDLLQKQQLSIILDALLPSLGREIEEYCMVDDNSENCGFAPYFFIGEKIIIIVAREWEL